MSPLSVYTDHIPKFEGREVAGAAVRLTGKAPLDDLADVVLEVDDRVQLKATYTVVGVAHDVNKDGQLIRVHTLRPVEMSLAPFSNQDEGVIRAMPRIAGEVSKSTGEIRGGEPTPAALGSSLRPGETITVEAPPEPEIEPDVELGENTAQPEPEPEPEPGADPETDREEPDLQALLPTAAERCIKLQYFSTAMLERKYKLRIGPARQLTQMLEEAGIISGPLEGLMTRNVLIPTVDLDDALEAISS